MNHVPKRSESAPETRWKLEDLFESQAAWDKEFAEAKALIKKIPEFQGKLADVAQLKACFELEDELSHACGTALCICKYEASRGYRRADLSSAFR